jgi:hypothetical protein
MFNIIPNKTCFKIGLIVLKEDIYEMEREYCHLFLILMWRMFSLQKRQKPWPRIILMKEEVTSIISLLKIGPEASVLDLCGGLGDIP